MIVFIELYGRLRDCGVASPVEVEVPDNATAGDALAALKLKLGAKANLLEGSALAGESDVYSADKRLGPGRLAALPPVCGG